MEFSRKDCFSEDKKRRRNASKRKNGASKFKEVVLTAHCLILRIPKRGCKALGNLHKGKEAAIQAFYMGV